MAETVHLHIGASKTGTTYIQGLLLANRDELMTQQLLVPVPMADHFRFMLTVLEHVDDVRNPTVVRAGFERIVRKAARWPTRAIVSNELLAAATPARIAWTVGRLAPAQVEVIYTVRDLARTLPAEWQQAVKGGSAMRFDTFADGVVETASGIQATGTTIVGESDIIPKFHLLHEVPAVLSRWADVVGPEHVHLVTLPPAGSDPSVLWQRFATACGIDPQGPMKPPPRHNESLGVVDAELLRRVNEVLDEDDHDYAEREWVRRHYAISILMKRSPRTRIAIRQRHYDWATAQATGYVEQLAALEYDVVGDLSDLLPGDPPQDAAHPDEISPDDMGRAAVESISALLGLGRRTAGVADERERRIGELEAALAARAAQPGGRGSLPARAYRRIRRSLSQPTAGA